MQKKLVNIKDLNSIRLTNINKKIVLTHGVFDIVHIGHIEYLKEAKKFGDLLILSITGKKFVNKGLNRPYFDDDARIRFLCELEIIDFVVLSNDFNSTNIIKNLKPDFYIKGPDYKNKKNDKARNLGIEEKAVKKYGGQLKFTSGKLFSSTKILNSHFDDFKIIDQIKKINKIDSLYNSLILKDYHSSLKKIKKEKILIIGEIILDKYYYSESLGTPSKENILSVNFVKKKEYIGGSFPVVKIVSEFSNNVTFVSFLKGNFMNSRLKKKLNSDVNLKILAPPEFKDICKSRFIDINTNKKIFEFYEFSNTEIHNIELEKYLKSNLKKFDKVIVCDFGHGLFTTKVVNLIESKSKFLCVNVQTNSGNRGFNLFNKFSKANLLVLDEPEIRLGLSDKYSSLDKIINSKKLKLFNSIMITRGIKGLLYKNNRINSNKYLNFPALNTKAVDTMGAGDAAYSYASLFVNNTSNSVLIGLLSSIAGAIKTTILGHENFVQKSTLEKSFENLLKL